MPRVSVIIPTYNCGVYLGRAIDSVLSQSYRDYEILVVDDGSTDDTPSLASAYGDKIRYLRQENRGLSAARNRALIDSNGEFIAYLDADDIWCPQKLAQQVEFLDAHQDCGLLHSDVSVIDEKDQVIHARFNMETARPVPKDRCKYDILRRCHIQIATVIERRKCIEKIGGFNERLIATQDYMHWIMVAIEDWTFGYIDEPLAKYRWRAGSLMSSKRRILEDHARMFGSLLPELYHGHADFHELSPIIHGRFAEAERELAYLDRIEGDSLNARRRLMALIRQSPLKFGIYVDLAKTCLNWNNVNRRTSKISGTKDNGGG
jgi:glycosyltransferase involved in cell wall biosynthesis